MESEIKTEQGAVARLAINKWFKLNVRAYTMIGALIFIWVLFSLLNDTFLTPRNLSNLFLQMSVIAVLAIGMVLIIVAGQIDLSVGSLVGMLGGVAAIMNVWWEWPAAAVIVCTILLGTLIGIWQGWWVAYRGVPAFIVTLGGMLVFRGILMGVTDSQTIAGLSPGVKGIGQGYVSPFYGIALAVLCSIVTVVVLFRKRAAKNKYGFEVPPLSVHLLQCIACLTLIFGFVWLMNTYRGIPIAMLIVISLCVLFTLIANKSAFGRQVYAVGGNVEAAKLSGINIKKRILAVFVLGNTLAGIAALILTARVNAATAGAGEMYELDAIAACVIGGTSLMGGTGSIFGAVIGALVMASLDNGMSIMNIDSFWQLIVKGSILILAVWVDMYSRNRKKKA